MEIFAVHDFQINLALHFIFNNSCPYPVNLGDLTYGNEARFVVLLLCYPIPSRITFPGPFPTWPAVRIVFYMTGCPNLFTGEPCIDLTGRRRRTSTGIQGQAISYESPRPDRWTGGKSVLSGTPSDGQSLRSHSEQEDLSWLSVFSNLTHLYLIEVKVDTSTLPVLEHLHTLVIQDGTGVMEQDNYDLRHLSHVQEVFLTLGETTLHSDFVMLESDSLQYVEVAVPNAKVNSLEINFINLGASGGRISPPASGSLRTVVPEVTMKVNRVHMPFVLYPVFLPLLKVAVIHWVNDDGTYVSCDHCGIAWFWTLSEQELECLQVACTNPEGQLMMAQDYIRGGGSNPCAIYFG